MKFTDPKVFQQFDKKICELSLSTIYYSGSDFCCFWPPQIMAAAMIKMADQELEGKFLSEDWLQNVTRKYDEMAEVQSSIHPEDVELFLRRL